jgi:hypothetical protein
LPPLFFSSFCDKFSNPTFSQPLITSLNHQATTIPYALSEVFQILNGRLESLTIQKFSGDSLLTAFHKSVRPQIVLEPEAAATGSPLTRNTSFLNEVSIQPHPVATASGSDSFAR